MSKKQNKRSSIAAKTHTGNTSHYTPTKHDISKEFIDSLRIDLYVDNSGGPGRYTTKNSDVSVTTECTCMHVAKKGIVCIVYELIGKTFTSLRGFLGLAENVTLLNEDSSTSAQDLKGKVPSSTKIFTYTDMKTLCTKEGIAKVANMKQFMTDYPYGKGMIHFCAGHDKRHLEEHGMIENEVLIDFVKHARGLGFNVHLKALEGVTGSKTTTGGWTFVTWGLPATVNVPGWHNIKSADGLALYNDIVRPSNSHNIKRAKENASEAVALIRFNALYTVFQKAYDDGCSYREAVQITAHAARCTVGSVSGEQCRVFNHASDEALRAALSGEGVRGATVLLKKGRLTNASRFYSRGRGKGAGHSMVRTAKGSKITAAVMGMNPHKELADTVTKKATELIQLAEELKASAAE